MNNNITTDNSFAAIPNWFIESGVSPQAGWLYVWLKKYADYSTNDAFPSRRTLAEKIGLKKPASVDPYIRELIDAGALRVEHRFDEGRENRQTSNLYTVITARPGHLSPEGDTPVPPGGPGESSGGDGARPADRTRTKNQETKIQENVLLTADAVPVRDIFEEFWEAYPRKIRKKVARERWDKAIKREDPEVILWAAKTYAADCKATKREATYIKYPEGWLSGDMWEDYRTTPATPRKSTTNWADAL